MLSMELYNVASFIDASELSHCCTIGKIHFEQLLSCAEIKLNETASTCILTASICCMDTLLEHNCNYGIKMAESEDQCLLNITDIGGGIRKECCECCLLAKELSRNDKSCVAPNGFGAACLRSFHQCCFENAKSKQYHRNSDLLDLLSVGDRCISTKCEHLCTDRGGATVECSCHPGYELGPDGYSCIDINECDARDSVCPLPNSLCLNTPGSFSCVCLPGFYWSDIGSVCVDIDECLLLADDCLESQRCLNTPGSFKCIRTLSCGTGYALDSDTEQCIDVDECNLGSHDCGPLYQCRNTQGSYRCDPKKCAEGELMNPRTGECTNMDCPIGYKPIRGRCEDVNECEIIGRCAQFEECINTPGSFRCQERGNLCTNGYRMDRDTGFCVDINECADGTHFCGDKQCINLLGSYKCRCSAGFEFNDTTKRCEDVDECKKFAGHVCSLHATCENTYGSFKCHCKDGFKIAKDARNCDDIDECSLGKANCAQKCINIPGSYQCICERGYRLGADGVTCEDIDECTLWAGSGDDLCMGRCINTPGSYKCQCPVGYEIQEDGRTCKDVDECAKGECQGNDQICVNTLGSFKCHVIRCPLNYMHDKNYKNRCNRLSHLCDSLTEEACKNHAIRISWEFTSIPKQEPISSRRTSITLFTVRGPTSPSSNVQFELKLKSAIPEKFYVLPAVRSNFLLQKSEEKNGAIIALRDSLDGPQEVILELILRLSINGVFQRKDYLTMVTCGSPIFTSISSKSGNNILVDDGYSCLKRCYPNDPACISNHTQEILYQFRSLPSTKHVKHPIEISHVRAQMDTPFSVEYKIDKANRDRFVVQQDQNIGIVKMIAPIEGPKTVVVMLHLNIYSRSHVLLTHNIAIITQAVCVLFHLRTSRDIF
uniref:Fibulin-1 n=1 Tax=Brugia malayi TaxID=6279 RepID=A0A1I9G299_BRUMA|nr:Bm4501, isoform f [Brugia malayi]